MPGTSAQPFWCMRGAAGYEVEFTSLDGSTIAVVTLMANQVRPAQSDKIAHVRALVAA